MNSSVSGVAFSRHPLKPISSDSVFIEAVYGLGEGLVGGELEADRYEVTILHESQSLYCECCCRYRDNHWMWSLW